MFIGNFGQQMRLESGQAASVLLNGLGQEPDLSGLPFKTDPTAIYTVARGSSDAAATVLNYEFMRQFGVPSTTLPPSVFSLGRGVDLSSAMVVTLSQSGASEDLVAATRGAGARGANVVAITNVDRSPVEDASHARLPILAGQELAVPATKSVVGAIAAGCALIGSYRPGFAADIQSFARACTPNDIETAQFDATLPATIAQAKHIFVVGREGLFGVAQEVALKIKECCGIHAEAYSASEVLHGPLQLAGDDLVTILLDDGSAQLRPGLDLAASRLSRAGSHVERLSLRAPLPAPQAVSGAIFLIQLYPIILEAALNLGLNPDTPDALAKVTQTL